MVKEKEVEEQLEFAKESMGFIPEIMRLMGKEKPEWFNLYKASDKAIWKDSALSAKIKVLMAMAVVAGRLCPECVEMQMRSAINHGATKEEILDTLGVVFVTSGAPGVNVCKEAMKTLFKED
jgi:alkylhydroperoxidase/carboxymuconolactone decarboxylase family protein YurZ